MDQDFFMDGPWFMGHVF